MHMLLPSLALVASLLPLSSASQSSLASHNRPSRLPSSSQEQGIRIPLTKRSSDSNSRPIHARLKDEDGVANLGELNTLLKGARTKYQRGARRYHQRTGLVLPGFQLSSVSADLSSLATGALDAVTGLLGKKKKRQNQVLTEYEDGLLWAGPVSVGTPGQEFVVNFDTGSSDFWIPDVSVSNGHSTYNPAASSTRQDSNDTFGILYGDGSSVSGKVYQDTITIAGLSAEQQHFASATTVSPSFTSDPGDGVLGLGFESISNMGETPFFNTLVEQGKVKEQMFSFELGKGSEGELFLGGMDSSRFQGEVTWTEVTQAGYWMVKGSSYANSRLSNPAGKDNTNFIVDTGTTLIIAPPAEAKAFFAQVRGAKEFQNGYFQYPCRRPITASFAVKSSSSSDSNAEEKRFTVPEEFLNLGLTAVGSDMCVAAIVGTDVGINSWILGDVFLRSVYSVYDFNNGAPRVGLADLA